MSREIKIIKWSQVNPAEVRALFPDDMQDVKVYLGKGRYHHVLQVIISRDCGKWHLSISCSKRNPDWEEMVNARYSLLPDVRNMCMILPPIEEYVDIHKHCFHLYEMPDEKIDG